MKKFPNFNLCILILFLTCTFTTAIPNAKGSTVFPSNKEIINENMSKHDVNIATSKNTNLNTNTNTNNLNILNGISNNAMKDNNESTFLKNEKNDLNTKKLDGDIKTDKDLISKVQINRLSNLKDKKTKYELKCIKSDVVENLKPTDFQNKNCDIKTDKIKYISNINKKTRVLDCTPVVVKLTKNTLSVYLDNLPNSIINSIRLQDINFVAKVYGLSLSCIELTSTRKDDLTRKALSLCFDNENDLLKWVGNIRDMKRCSLTFETSEFDKLIKDYKVLQFLQNEQSKLEQGLIDGGVSKNKINEKLRDLYYENSPAALNKAANFQEQLIEKILDQLIEKSLAEQAKAESRERQLKSKTEVKACTKGKTTTISVTQKTSDNKTSTIKVQKTEGRKSINNEKEEVLSSRIRLDQNNDIIKELKKTSLVLSSNNICSNKNNQNGVSEVEFRTKVCEILNNEADSEVECHVNSKVKFCTVCCETQSKNHLDLLETCVKECNSF